MNRDWTEKAACRGTDIDVFFGSEGGRAHLAEALKLCARCPVRAECLQFALRIEGGKAECWRHGVFGGTTGPDRYRMYRKAGRKPAATREAA